MNDHTQSERIDRLRRALDEAAAGMDHTDCERLANARRRALDSALSAGTGLARYRYAAAACVVLGLTFVLAQILNRPMDSESTSHLTPSLPAPELIADLELLGAEDELALLEDLEFLAWLSTVEDDRS
ncbi:MAG: hypothetical protein AAF610_10725 [Pseudomonadota bacterium]